MNLTKQHPILTGAFILACTGFLTRIIGFLYRMFLLKSFGAESLGIYQLITPVLVISYAFSISGFQVAISKFTASESVKHQDNPTTFLNAGLLISLSLSALASLILYRFSDSIAIHILKEARTAPLIRIAAFTIPADAVHSCINGYYYGLRKIIVPAVSQLTEQIFRVLSVFLIVSYITSMHQIPLIEIAVLGLLVGEIVSLIISTISVIIQKRSLNIKKVEKKVVTRLIRMSVPITMNRIIVNLFVSTETILIPSKLKLFGLSSSDALSEFGMLTGMVMPLILFPGALVNSACTLLLPTISQASERKESDKLIQSVQKSYIFSVIFGLFCFLVFLFFGKITGRMLFHSEISGIYIMKLSILCPFIYISMVSHSIINGIGKTFSTFFISIIGLFIRILFVLYSVPTLGSKGYLNGIIISQIITASLSVIMVIRYLKNRSASN